MTKSAVSGLAEQSRPEVAAIIVEQGKVLDFIDGKTQRPETLEEYVRQEIAKSLVREYGYAKGHIEVEFIIRMGTRKPRADLVIFAPDAPHDQEHARIIVECKSPKVKAADRKNGVAQLESYLAACPNAIYGLWTNGSGGERLCFRRVVRNGEIFCEPVPDIPEAGRDDVDADRPRFDQQHLALKQISLSRRLGRRPARSSSSLSTSRP